MGNNEIKYCFEKFKSLHLNKIDINSQSFLESEFLSLTSLTKINDYLVENNIDTGDFLFGFKNSLLFFENGFFSRNTKKLYLFSELKKCSFKTKGRLIKNKRLVLSLRHSEFNLDLSPYESNLDEKVLRDLSQIFNLTKKQIEENQLKEKEENKKQSEENKKNLLVISQIEEELTKISSLFLSKKKELIKNENLIIESDRIIKKHERSIKLEDDLKKLPDQCIGSIILYNYLNQNKELFTETQFKNIVRFLDYLESNENNYRNLYVESHKKYLKDPFHPCYKRLYNYLKVLKELYFYSSIIISEVNRDVVLFNKVYNYLEDKGFFLNDIEKSNYENLNKISRELYDMNFNLNKKFSELIKSVNYQNEKLDLINKNLNHIDSSLFSIDVNTSILFDINNKLD